jgi:uncharacterized membrane protein YkgB
MEKREYLLRASIAILFLIFGGLKFFPHLSPAEVIGADTVQKLTCSILPKWACINALAVFEVGIGLLLLSNKYIKIAITLAIIHMVCTFSPFIFYPEEVFNLDVHSLSLLGQYILKNIVIISALLLIYPRQHNYQTINISNH